METSAHSVDGLYVSADRIKWTSAHARKFHHQLGYAMRRVQKIARETVCWQDGKRLAGQLSEWTKVLNGQLATKDCGRSGRVLMQHLSDATTGLPGGDAEDEDVASIATTAPWSHAGRTCMRQPRKRPNRRAKRSARLQEEQRTIVMLAREGALEMEWSAGSLPSEAIAPLVAALETIDEFDCFGQDFFEQEFHFSDAEDSVVSAGSQGVSPGSLVPQECCRNTSGSASACTSGKKRKLDSLGIEHDDRLHEEPSALASSSLQNVSATWRDFFDTLNSALMHLNDTLQAKPPQCLEGLMGLAGTLEQSCQQLQRVSEMHPCAGMVAARKALDFIDDEVVKRDSPGHHIYATSPGIFAWLASLRSLILEFPGLDDEEQESALDDVSQDMELHACTAAYCIDTVQEAFEEESENQVDIAKQVEHAIQQRLAFSLASRR